MTTSQVYLIAIPQNFFNQRSEGTMFIGERVQDALGIERRIQKELNLENEYARYSLICAEIERTVLDSNLMKFAKDADIFSNLLQQGNFSTWVMPPEYLSVIAHSLETENELRIGASFHAPVDIDKHINNFTIWAKEHELDATEAVQEKTAFYKLALANQAGVVEILTNFQFSTDSVTENSNKIYFASIKDDQDSMMQLPEFEIGEEANKFTNSPTKQQEAKQLREQIITALNTSEPIILGNQAKHDVITEVLNEFVFVDNLISEPVNLRIMYVDGSEASLFPLNCLEKTDISNNHNPLRAALMSMRHFELDDKVDFCWLRNREVSQSRILSETDAFCHKTTLKQLEEALNGQDEFHLQLFHTGFEPAVIGFYRALTEFLIRLRSLKTYQKVTVTPQYFRGGDNYEPGSSWGYLSDRGKK